MVESALHQIELSAKKPRSNFGMAIFGNILSVYNHGGDALQLVDVTKNIEKIREKANNEKLFEGLIQKYLLDNKHRVTVIMTPNENYQKL